MELKIESSQEYMWRVNASGGELNYVKCFHVFDTEGNMVAGGYRSGSNVHSGSPVFARKMDAIAFVAGYSDYLRGLDGLTYKDASGFDHVSRDGADRYVKTLKTKTLYLDQIINAYSSGVHCAMTKSQWIEGAHYSRVHRRVVQKGDAV